MNSSSPANSSISTAAIVAGGGGTGSNAAQSLEEIYFPSDLISIHDRKQEAMLEVKSELMSELNKIAASLDEDSWMFEGPVSRINLISKKGDFLQKLKERLNSKITGPPQ